MKTCPVCQATLFDDMAVCYGCMYEFGLKPGLEEAQARTGALEGADAVAGAFARAEKGADASACAGAGAGVLAAARPRGEGPKPEGAPPALPWTVRLEMRSNDDPQASWSVELVPSPRSGTAAISGPDRPAEPRLLGVR